MPKVKNHIVKEKKDYFNISICVTVVIVCIFLIGRVGTAGYKLAIILGFIFGDFSTLLLAIILCYSVVYVLFKKKINYHHIFFIGGSFIFLAVLMFTHLGLYNELGMTNTTIISKTLNLYKHYLKRYEVTYSCGGGIIGAFLVQITAILLGRIGTIIVGIAFIVVGISYFTNLDILHLFKGGKITKIPKKILYNVKDYFSNIYYPESNKKPYYKVSINMLEDIEPQGNLSLQAEINKEKYEDLKKYIRDNKIMCMLDELYTSYSSSRIVLKFAKTSENEFRLIIGFFNNQAILIKNSNDYYLDFPNQFRKLLTLKSILIPTLNNEELPLALDVNGQNIDLDVKNGKLLVIVGDYNSGVKTMLKSLVLSILIKNIKYSSIYFYDFNNEFTCLNNSIIKYVNNEKSASIALDEAFSEYERRSEVLKHFNCDSIDEVNNVIKKSNIDMEYLYPEFHFLSLDITKVSLNLLQKITYAIRFSIKVGITIIISTRGKNELQKIELNKANIVSFNINDVSTSLKLFGSDIACRLQKKGDVIIRKNNELFHGQAPYVSNSDFEKIVEK